MHPPVGLEWIVILVLVVILFGAKKIPDLAKGLGEGLREFKKAQKEAENDVPAAADKAKIEDKAAEVKKPEEKK